MNINQLRFYKMMIGFMKEIQDPATTDIRIKEIEAKLPAIEARWGGTDQIIEEIAERANKAIK